MKKQFVWTLGLALLATLVALPTTAQIIVQPAPPAIPIPPQPVPPDLTASGLQILSPATLRCGTQTVTFQVTEGNGGGNAGSYHLDLTYDYGSATTFWPICRYARPGLGALSSRVFGPITCTFWNGPCDCLPSTYTATFRANIDVLNAVAESNEGNNLSNRVSIPATCP
jgi:hypothetical protein